MLEPNDIAFRLLCKKAGAGLTYTGLISPQSKQKLILDDKPALQLFANSTKNIKQFIKKYDSKVSLWDFNLGCPSKLAKKSGFGAYLDDLEIIEKILKEMRANTKKPVTIKIRKSGKSFEILKIAEKYCDAVTIHARTNGQGYSGKTDFKFALKIKKKTDLQVIYSGDVSEKNAEEILKEFDFVMVGREAIGRPCIFGELLREKCEIGFKDYLKLAKKYKLPFKQIKYQAMNFTKGIRGAKRLRNQLARAKSVEEVEEIVGCGNCSQISG